MRKQLHKLLYFVKNTKNQLLDFFAKKSSARKYLFCYNI